MALVSHGQHGGLPDIIESLEDEIRPIVLGFACGNAIGILVLGVVMEQLYLSMADDQRRTLARPSQTALLPRDLAGAVESVTIMSC